MRWTMLMLAILLFACTDNTKVPSDVISRAQMQKIMWEMVQADRYANIHLQTRKDSLGINKKETFELYDKVFSLNGITRQDFVNSYKYYLGRPDLMKVMFDSISAQAERRREEIFNRPKDSATVRADSIRAAQRSDSLKRLSRRNSLMSVGSRDSLRRVMKRDSIAKVRTADSLRKARRSERIRRTDSVRKAARIDSLQRVTRTDSLRRVARADSLRKATRTTAPRKLKQTDSLRKVGTQGAINKLIPTQQRLP